MDRTSRKPGSRPCPWRASRGLTGGWHDGSASYSDADRRRGGCTWWNPTVGLPAVDDDEDDERDDDGDDTDADDDVDTDDDDDDEDDD